MNEPISPSVALNESERASASATKSRLSRIAPGVRRGWKFFLGVVFCQSLLTSFLVVGWTYRLVQRAVLRHWWQRSSLRGTNVSFEDFVRGSSQTQIHVSGPNWILGQVRWRSLDAEVTPDFRSRVRRIACRTAGSLWLNFKLGFQGMFNTWVLTLPGCVLWLFAWYDGWNNSFNKGYEQAAVGPLTGVFGVVLFIAAMFYVPMAQARQAATGQWKSFYQFRTVWNLVRRRWLACLGLAILFCAAALPLTILKTAPQFFPNLYPGGLANLDQDQVRHVLKVYFFWSGFVFFPCYVGLRLVAARIYAGALPDAIQRGAIAEDALAEIEWEALHRLDLLHVRPESPRHVLIRLAAWVGTRAGRATVAVALVIVWFIFVAQIFASEFLNYHPGVGWLNQPLVQLPWFRYLPPASH